MKTLLSFIGSRDPFVPGNTEGEDCSGPLLSLVAALPVEKAVLLYTEQMKENATSTARALAIIHPDTTVELRRMDIGDPTDYAAILRSLRELIGHLLIPITRGISVNYHLLKKSAAGRLTYSVIV